MCPPKVLRPRLAVLVGPSTGLGDWAVAAVLRAIPMWEGFRETGLRVAVTVCTSWRVVCRALSVVVLAKASANYGASLVP